MPYSILLTDKEWEIVKTALRVVARNRTPALSYEGPVKFSSGKDDIENESSMSYTILLTDKESEIVEIALRSAIYNLLVEILNGPKREARYENDIEAVRVVLDKITQARQSDTVLAVLDKIAHARADI